MKKEMCNKKNLVLILALFAILFFLHTTYAKEISGMNVSVDLKTHENTDNNYLVVGESLFYEIHLDANENIDDTIKVIVTDPKGDSISELSFPLKLEKGIKGNFAIKNIDGNDTIAIPLDLSGDYNLRICSQKGFKFYRWFDSTWKTSPIYVWYSPCMNFPFGVVSKYEYQQILENQNNIENNKKQTTRIIELTKWLLGLTIALFILQLLTLSSTKNGKKIFFTF